MGADRPRGDKDRLTEEHEIAVKSWMALHQAILRKALTDPSVNARLLKDPSAVCRELGADLPPGVEIKVLESTATTVYFAMPPSSDVLRYLPRIDLIDADLTSARGGPTRLFKDDFDFRHKKDHGQLGDSRPGGRADGNDQTSGDYLDSSGGGDAGTADKH